MAPQSARHSALSKDDIISPVDSRAARFEPLEVSDGVSDNEGSRRKSSWWKSLLGRTTWTKREAQFYGDDEGEGNGLLDGADVSATRELSRGERVSFSHLRLCKQRIVFCLMYVFGPTNHIIVCAYTNFRTISITLNIVLGLVLLLRKGRPLDLSSYWGKPGTVTEELARYPTDFLRDVIP